MRKVVLFADDDPISQMNVKLLFGKLEEEYELYIFSKGEDLIEKLSDLKSCYAVICDLHLKSRLSGAEVLSLAQKLSPGAKFALLSNTPRVVAANMMAGVTYDTYIDAPIELSDLVKFL